MADFVDRAAEVASQDSDIDSEAGETRHRENGGAGVADSSEEEESEDEEAARVVREGFIVDDDDDDADDDEDEEVRRMARRKRRREQREREEALDADDLEVIGIRAPEAQDDESQPKFKRLKQGHREVRKEIFSDDEDERLEDDRPGVGIDEMADFIEQDEFSDDDRELMRDEQEVARPGRMPFSIDKLTAGLDETSLEDYRAAFGTGDEYQWALDLEEVEEEEKEAERGVAIQDVFEPGQLAEKLLTEDDIEIRTMDIPERLQIARKGLIALEDEPGHEGELLQEESDWISDLLLAKKRFNPELTELFRKAVTNVLRFLNEDNLEVPYIEQHRHDYIIHSLDLETGIEVVPLISQAELWKILELDLRFRAFVEKRRAVLKSYNSLGEFSGTKDAIIAEMLPKAVMMEEIQDVQDYLHFQYSAEFRDMNAADKEAANGTHRRPRTGKNQWESIRSTKAYDFVRAIGITADAFAHNALGTGSRNYTEDATERPDTLADSLLQPPEFNTSSQVLRLGKSMFVEELVNNPRMRQYMRKTYFQNGVIDCIRTEKGRLEITEDHRYYDFKYLRNLEFASVARKPELFLRMLRAESEGLVTIEFRILNHRSFRQKLYSLIESDGFSAVADEWNAIRRELIDAALDKLGKIISRGVQDALRQECESTLANTCREKLLSLLDQAAYQPPELDFGDKPTVLALSSGRGVSGRDAICWIFMDVNGYVKESGKFTDIRPRSEDDKTPPGEDNAKFIDLVVRQKPDVIAVSGFSVETRKNAKDLEEILREYEKISNPESEPHLDEAENKEKQFVRPDVVVVSDEVARLYYNSDRASIQFPHLPPLGRYCVALARYLRNPLLEYASLGNDITSIVFERNQDLLPKDKLLRCLESAIVDITNVSGVNLEDAMYNPYVAVSLQYICGLGPRKAQRLLETIKHNGGVVTSRAELVGDADRNIAQAMGPVVWNNCASFLYLEYQENEPTSEYLDNTRIHPEDYVIARKISADALRIDEEDVADEIRTGGASAVVRRLITEEQQGALKMLDLHNYANVLFQKFGQRKMYALETIRDEITKPYEELRKQFQPIAPEDVFTMLTGETKDSLAEGMIVPVKIKKVFANHMEVKLDCGIDGGISSEQYPKGVGGDGEDPRRVYSQGQTVLAKLLFLNRKMFTAQLSLGEDALSRSVGRRDERIPSEWDSEQESEDKRLAQKEKETKAGRAQRVIKHVNFHPFNSAQAEEYLGSKNPGDLIIRPSSRGLDHLAITWKVADNVYQHIDVLELDKENEFAIGKTLKIGGKYTYSDLDDLIVNHVNAMARKVNEMMNDERYQNGSKSDTDKWLQTYTEANPKRSMYAFCINPKFPGYFHLCFKAGRDAPLGDWSVKVVPKAFELRRSQYPNMQALKNGFKTMIASANGRV